MPFRLVQPGESTNDRDVLLRAAKTLRDEFDTRMQIQDLRQKLQDVWFLMYLMVDKVQDGQLGNRQKHYTNRIPSVVDTARRALARNPLKYHVASNFFKASAAPERAPFQKLENVLHGVMYDIDRQLLAKKEPRSRQQAAFHSLVRGAWAYKLHLSTSDQYQNYTGSPIFYTQLDPRKTLPVIDQSVSSAIAWDVVSFNQLYYRYQSVLSPVMEAARAAMRRLPKRRAADWSWLHTPLLMLDYSSREEMAVLVDLSGLPADLCMNMGISKTQHTQERYVWLQKPIEHGFDWSLIQYGNVNGVPASLPTTESSQMFLASPHARLPLYEGGSQTTGMVNVTPQMLLPSGGGYQPLSGTIDPMLSMAGRSIFANVAHLIPEYNDLLGLLKDAVYKEVRGTYAFTSRTGSLIELEIGSGAVNPLQMGERLEKVRMDIATPDAMNILQQISQEISDGSLDLRFVLASEQDASGYLRQRMEQAALLALEDYKDGIQDWAVSVADSFIRQYRAAGKDALSDWKVTGRQPSQMTNFFVADVDDQVWDAIHGKEPPVIEASVKAALPVDMMAKINMAKAAIDPSNPVMGLQMALDIIMEIDDAEAVYDMILEDVGNRNPTIQLLRIAQAFTENGAEPIAQMILTNEFRNAFAASQGMTGTGGTPGATSTPTGASPGIQAGTTPPEVTSGGATEQTGRMPVPQGNGGGAVGMSGR